MVTAALLPGCVVIVSYYQPRPVVLRQITCKLFSCINESSLFHGERSSINVELEAVKTSLHQLLCNSAQLQ